MIKRNKRNASHLNNTPKKGLCVVALASFMALAMPSLYSCADKDMLVDNSKGVEHDKPSTDVTSVIRISGSSNMERPVTRAIDEDGRLTRAVTLNEKFLPISAGSDFTARIFLVKKEDGMYDENGRLKEFEGKIAAAEMKWNKVTDLTGGGVHLDAAPQNITLHWVNEKSQPVQIKKGDVFYVAGVIGGAYDPDLKPGAKYFNTNTGQWDTVKESKLYYTSVSFDPYNPEVAKYNNTKDKHGNLRVAAAFVTDWKEIKIAKDNEISLRNFNFKAIGTLFRIKVHRDTKLIDSKAHCYRFVSSQMSGSGSFLFGVTVSDGYHDVCTKPNKGSLMSNWYWDNEKDETKYFWLNQTEKATGDNDRSYEFHYVYDADKLRQTTQNEYDVFYVWGMPFDKKTEVNARLDNMTCITLEKGGAMLGKKHKHIFKNKTSTTYYADEWCYGEGDTDEWTKFDLTKSNGKAYNVELKVMRPAFSAKDSNGKPKYPWPNQLERFSKTICKINERGFADEVFFDNKTKDAGKVDNYTITPRELKRRDINDGGTNTSWIYPNFMVPSNDQWEVVFPNIKESDDDYYSLDKDWWFDGKKGKKGENRFERKPYEEVFTFDDGGAYPLSEKDEETKAKNKAATNLFYGFYYPNPCIRELYAIRFDGHKTSNDQKEGNVFGRRYRCAYRYRFINTGDMKYRYKDDKTCATFDDVKDKQGHIGRRLVVQSRWIGNAYVPLDSLQSETWWGKADNEGAEFSNVDCYRVFPSVGYNYSRMWGGNVSLYMTRTYFKVDTYFNYTDPNNYADKYFRRICNDRFGRGHEQNGLGNYYPVMPIVKLSFPENDKDAPRFRIVRNYQECVRRKWDTDDSWRNNDKNFAKDRFRVKYRR